MDGSYFEDYLNTHQPFFVTNPNILDLHDVADIVLNLIKDSMTEPALAKYIFEYANRIGAYMMYVFIESLRSRRNVKSDDVRSILTEQFLTQAVPLMDLLQHFLLNIPIIDATEKRSYELNDSALEKVLKSYKDLYPNTYKTIEDGYQNFANILHSTDDQAIENSKNCLHDWKERYVHKIGYRYFCPKCDAIVASLKDIGGTASN